MNAPDPGQAGVREVFVYYRVADAAAALRAVHALHARLGVTHPHLRARLLRRTDDDGGAPTWMEHYAGDPALAPQGVGIAEQARIEAEAAGLLAWIDGPRHAEVFMSA